jgi:hypothetical protein
MTRVYLPTSPLSDRPIRLRLDTLAGPLQLHADAKTGPLAFWGTDRRPVSVVPNALALPAGPVGIGGTCPQLSPNACRACYAVRLEVGPFADFGRVIARNLDTVRGLRVAGGRHLVEALAALVDRSAALQSAAGVAVPSFRWFSSGDVFAPWLASAVRDVQRARPSVAFWGYTRSVKYLPNLLGRSGLPDNARWFVSVDSENVTTHARAAARYGLPVAYLAADAVEVARLREIVEAVRGERSRGAVCPAGGAWSGDGFGPSYVSGLDGRRASLARGHVVGACAACGVCLPSGAVRDVTFMRHGGAGSAATWQRLEVRRGVRS